MQSSHASDLFFMAGLQIINTNGGVARAWWRGGLTGRANGPGPMGAMGVRVLLRVYWGHRGTGQRPRSIVDWENVKNKCVGND